MTFCNIFVISEDTSLNLGICVRYPKSNQNYQGRQFKMHFFFRIMSLFRLRKTLTFCIISVITEHQNYAPLSTDIFLISLLLLKILTRNSEYVFTIQRATHSIKGDNTTCISSRFRLRLFILYQPPHSRALTPACDTFVNFGFRFLSGALFPKYELKEKNVNCQ